MSKQRARKIASDSTHQTAAGKAAAADETVNVDNVHATKLQASGWPATQCLEKGGFVHGCLADVRLVDAAENDDAAAVSLFAGWRQFKGAKRDKVASSQLKSAARRHGGELQEWTTLIPPESRGQLPYLGLGTLAGMKSGALGTIARENPGVVVVRGVDDIERCAREATARALAWRGFGGGGPTLLPALSRDSLVRELADGRRGVPLRVIFARGIVGLDDSDAFSRALDMTPVFVSCGDCDNVLSYMYLNRHPRFVDSGGCGIDTANEVAFAELLSAHSAPLMSSVNQLVRFVDVADDCDDGPSDWDLDNDNSDGDLESDDSTVCSATLQMVPYQQNNVWFKAPILRFDLMLAPVEPIARFIKRALLGGRSGGNLVNGRMTVLPSSSLSSSAAVPSTTRVVSSKKRRIPRSSAASSSTLAGNAAPASQSPFYHVDDQNRVVFSADEAQHFANYLREKRVVAQLREFALAMPFALQHVTIFISIFFLVSCADPLS